MLLRKKMKQIREQDKPCQDSQMLYNLQQKQQQQGPQFNQQFTSQESFVSKIRDDFNLHVCLETDAFRLL